MEAGILIMNAVSMLVALVFTYVLNVPFGYWRAYARRRGGRLEWFAAVHAPVPLVFAARIVAGATLTTIPMFVAAFFLGQLSGGLVKGGLEERLGETGKCLVHDLRLLMSRGVSGKNACSSND